MLHCNMTTSLVSLQHGLEDILGDLRFARRSGDLGRLALLTYCEVRRWAREANAQELAKRSSALMENFPYPSRTEFLAAVDALVVELEHVHCSLTESLSASLGSHDANGLNNRTACGFH
ncbi:hypothetical protein POHY109586_11495 [Polaromonas hydrogenivorans]